MASLGSGRCWSREFDELLVGIHVHPLIRCKKDDVWVSRAEMRHRMCGLANMSHSNQMHPANTAVVGVRPSPRIIAGVRSGWIPALGNRVSTVRYPIPQRTFKYVATVHSVTDETCQDRK